MAVNINNVYQTVLTIINKENRGYLTPDEFNRLANIAQLEIFEGYFLKDLTVAQSGVTADDAANPMMTLSEKINELHSTATLTSTDNNFDLDQATGYYRLEVVDVNGVIADQVSHKDLRYINLSPLTAPTTTQPIFTYGSSSVSVFPDTVREITVDYLRQPAEPRWGFLMDPDMMPVYNSADSIDFELHPSEEHELVYKILGLAGVVIRDQEVTGVGTGKEQAIQATEQ